jgi:hypothetical protein
MSPVSRASRSDIDQTRPRCAGGARPETPIWKSQQFGPRITICQNSRGAKPSAASRRTVTCVGESLDVACPQGVWKPYFPESPALRGGSTARNANMEKVTKNQKRKIYLLFVPPSKPSALSGARLQTRMLNRLEARLSIFDPSQKVYAVV